MHVNYFIICNHTLLTLKVYFAISDDMDKKIKHLEIIQGSINRISGNSFLLKGWSVTLIIALFALLGRDGGIEHAILALFIFVIFWILDGYFLSQERLFRDLYDFVRKLKDRDVDFSMNTKKYYKGKNTFLCSFLSKILLIFYFPITILLLIIIKNIFYN